MMNSNYLQTVCGACKAPISLQQDWQINGLAACGLCMYDYELTKTTLPCPYKIPRPRKLIGRVKKIVKDSIFTQTSTHGAQATCGYMSTEQLARFLQDPMGGL
jgi:hypothetical protein